MRRHSSGRISESVGSRKGKGLCITSAIGGRPTGGGKEGGGGLRHVPTDIVSTIFELKTKTQIATAPRPEWEYAFSLPLSSNCEEKNSLQELTLNLVELFFGVQNGIAREHSELCSLAGDGLHVLQQHNN